MKADDDDDDHHLSKDPEEDAMPIARYPPALTDGPDSGYLYGLKHLSASFEDIWQEERRLRIAKAFQESKLNGLNDDEAHSISIQQDLGELHIEGSNIFTHIFSDSPGGLDGYVST